MFIEATSVAKICTAYLVVLFWWWCVSLEERCQETSAATCWCVAEKTTQLAGILSKAWSAVQKARRHFLSTAELECPWTLRIIVSFIHSGNIIKTFTQSKVINDLNYKTPT